MTVSGSGFQVSGLRGTLNLELETAGAKRPVDPLRSVVVDLPIDQVFLTRKNTKVIRLGRNLAAKNLENTKRIFFENCAQLAFFAAR